MPPPSGSSYSKARQNSEKEEVCKEIYVESMQLGFITYLHFKVIIIEELLVHGVSVDINGSQEHSNGPKEKNT